MLTRPSSSNPKKVYTFFCWGEASPPPQTPPSSRLLSQPPQARFKRLSQVGRCRGLQGWEVLGLGPGQGLARRPWDQARDWPGGPGGPAGILSFFSRIKKARFVSFLRGVGYPPLKIKEKPGFFYVQMGVADPPPKINIFSFGNKKYRLGQGSLPFMP